MSYFDHVRCSHCQAMLDPESLGGGRGFACPRCGEELALADLFGVAAAFSEEDEPQLTLDDAVPNYTPRSGPHSGQSRGPAEQRRPGHSSGPLPASRGLPVRSGAQQGQPSALDLMRQMKGRKK